MDARLSTNPSTVPAKLFQQFYQFAIKKKGKKKLTLITRAVNNKEPLLLHPRRWLKVLIASWLGKLSNFPEQNTTKSGRKRGSFYLVILK